MSEIRLKSLREIIAERKIMKVEEKKESEIDEAMKLQDVIKLMNDSRTQLEKALQGLPKDLYTVSKIEDEVVDINMRILKLINALKAGNYNS